MISSSSQISSTTSLPEATQQAKNTGSSTSEIIASFKEIMAVMMAASSMPSSTEQAGMGMNQMMAPLMLLLLEKLVAGQVEQDGSTATNVTEASSSVRSEADLTDASQGSKPEPSGQPVTGRLTQNYHRGHNGLDIAIPVGTPIRTTMDGRVVHAGWNNQGYGNLVIVENGPYRTYYAHLSSIPVSVGDSVNAGSTIGLSGNTGNSTGPHLHYEIRRNLVPIDPTSATFGAGS